MQKLNLPSYQFKLKSSENKQLIFDIIRKKYVVLTPEEWVRQHLIHYLINDKKYPLSLIACEKQLVVNTLKRRFDILAFKQNGDPYLMVECKSPSVKISQKTFDQIAAYNLTINATYLLVSNGINHYICEMDTQNETYRFLKEIPEFRF